MIVKSFCHPVAFAFAFFALYTPISLSSPSEDPPFWEESEKEVIYLGQHHHSRPKRQDPNGQRYMACQMLVAIDEPLYQHYQSSLSNVTDLITDLVRRLNRIYYNTILRGEFAHLYFRIKEIRILYDFCTECNQTQRVYLLEFSRMDFSDFCLAHIFTYRDFPEGVQGLAWKGTLCSPRFNTGFTTLVNHQVSATREDSALTFAHEIGHNFGSDHDEEKGCSSDYIMSESGSNDINPQFSSCSTQDITKVLDHVLKHPRENCFVHKLESDPPDFSVCGDGIVEGDEQCDCGMSYRLCGDPCCYAAWIEPSDLYYNKSATPCRSNAKHICLKPFDSSWKYGFVFPWIFIFIVTLISSIILFYDWKHDKKLYTHVTKPLDMIRSETGEQMAKRLYRQASMGKTVYVMNSTKKPKESNRNSDPPLRQEQPQPGLVQQMKEQLERRSNQRT